MNVFSRIRLTNWKTNTNEVPWRKVLESLQESDKLNFSIFLEDLEKHCHIHDLPIGLVSFGSVLNPKDRPYRDIDLMLWPCKLSDANHLCGNIIPAFTSSNSHMISRGYDDMGGGHDTTFSQDTKHEDYFIIYWKFLYGTTTIQLFAPDREGMLFPQYNFDRAYRRGQSECFKKKFAVLKLPQA